MNKIIAYLSVICLCLLVYTGCKEDEELSLYANAGQSFLDIENDGYEVDLGASSVEDSQTGVWRVYNGSNGVFEDPNNPKSKFYGEPGEVYLLGWEVTEGEEIKVSTINVSYKELNPEILTVAGDTTWDKISLYLDAEAPKYGAEGKWEIIEGEGGRILNETSHNAEFVGTPQSDYTVRWTLSYGSKSEYEEFSFVTDSMRAYAGEDNLDIKSPYVKEEVDKYYNLTAFKPAGATASWSIIEGEKGEVVNNINATSLFIGVADTTYSLEWTVMLDGYTSIDTVDVQFRGRWGTWVDSRDDQAYRIVEANGLEWMADNYNYTPALSWQSPSGWGVTYYYGQSLRANIDDGHAVETEEDRKKYGRLYNWYAAAELAPEGWRLPTMKEYSDLFYAHGGPSNCMRVLGEGGEQGTDFGFPGSGGYGNNFPGSRDNYYFQDTRGSYWTANAKPEFFAGRSVLFLKNDNEEEDDFVVFPPEHSAYFPLYSVRYVRDIK